MNCRTAACTARTADPANTGRCSVAPQRRPWAAWCRAAPIAILVCTAGAASTRVSDRVAPDTWSKRAEELLLRIVTDDGLVNYAWALTQREPLDGLVRQLAAARDFKAPSETLAFHLNAYNLIVIQAVLDAWPVESVRAIEGFFNRRRYRVNGIFRTLDAIEHDVVRPLGDARIHAALVCGARSCPPLLRDVFRSKTLDEQLNQVTAAWIDDPEKNAVRNGALWISRIFKWYAKDFHQPPYGGVVDFLTRHAGQASAVGTRLARTPAPRIRYLQYDWALNAAPRKEE